MVLFALSLFACAPEPGAEALPDDLLPPGSVSLTAPTHVVTGRPNRFHVTGSLGDGETVWLLGSQATGAGNCPPRLGRLCLDLTGTVRVLGSGEVNGGAVDITWAPPPAVPVGMSASFQAVVVRGLDGVGSIKSATATRVVEADISGCTNPIADNYLPSATWDDGSCTLACAGTFANITSPADLAPIYGCRSLQALYLHQTSGVTVVDLPNLQTVQDYVYFHQNASVQQVYLPSLVSVGAYVYFHQNLALTTVDLGSLSTVGQYLYFNGNSSMTSIDVGALQQVQDYISFNGNGSACMPALNWGAITPSAGISAPTCP